MVRIGAHDREGDPLAVVHATGADIVQFFLGDPQGWDAPTFPGGDAAALRDALAAAGVDAYIHAPYGINVASANNRIRIPSRKLLAQQLEAAAAVGAKGLVVHGGNVTGGVADDVGYDNWRKAMERIPRPIPLLIENTAGGDQAGDDDYPLLAGGGDQLGVEAHHERGQPDPGRNEVPGDDEAERKGHDPRDESKDGEGVHHRVLLAVGVQRERRTGANPGDLRHRPPPFVFPRQVSGSVPARAGPESCARLSVGCW